MSATEEREGMKSGIVKIADGVVKEDQVEPVVENAEVAEVVEGDSSNYQIFKLN